MIFHWRQPGNFHSPIASVITPFFLLCYGLIGWFGPRFFSYRVTNLVLTFCDFFLVSIGFRYLPESLFSGAIVIYFVGIIINIFYGGYASSLGLSFLATLGFVLATFPTLTPEKLGGFYYKILNFNVTTLLFCVVGFKLKNIISLVEQEKDESKKQLHRLQALSRIAKEIAGELEIEKLLFLIVHKAAELTKSQVAGIILKDSDKKYRIKALKGMPKTFLEKEISPGIGLAGKVLMEKKTIIDKNQLYNSEMDHLLHLEHYKTAMAAPIWWKEGIMGLIFLLRDHQNVSFTKDDQLILDTLSEHAAIAVANANLFKSTANSSFQDYLTNVGNLRFFDHHLEHALAVAQRYQQSCSLLMVDSDCLNQINHQFGNRQGFYHIKQLAEVLKKSVRRSDLLARYDRDMFMIILPQTTLKEAIVLGEKIKAKVARTPVTIEGKTIETSVCVGVASYPEHAENAAMLVAEVESALRQAKQLGKNQLIAAKPL